VLLNSIKDIHYSVSAGLQVSAGSNVREFGTEITEMSDYKEITGVSYRSTNYQNWQR
jgi:hypothetical protein